MAFISVPEERFLDDVLKTWVTLFQEDTNFDGLPVLIKQPDIDQGFALPCMVIRRVTQEDWALTRLSGYHGRTIGTASVGRLCGYTYRTMYQFDVYTKTITEQNKFVTLINQKLKTVGTDVFADNSSPSFTEITLKDFPSPGSLVGVDTDLRIKFRYWRDITNMEVPTFDPELHQFSVSVSFWVDYLREYESPKISMISSDTEDIIVN